LSEATRLLFWSLSSNIMSVVRATGVSCCMSAVVSSLGSLI
jgi:hypothetical protein